MMMAMICSPYKHFPLLTMYSTLACGHALMGTLLPLQALLYIGPALTLWYGFLTRMITAPGLAGAAGSVCVDLSA